MTVTLLGALLKPHRQSLPRFFILCYMVHWQDREVPEMQAEGSPPFGGEKALLDLLVLPRRFQGSAGYW